MLSSCWRFVQLRVSMVSVLPVDILLFLVKFQMHYFNTEAL